MLQFHATPLLKPSWSANDIVLYGFTGHDDIHPRNNVACMMERILDPHLKIKVGPKELYSTIIHQPSSSPEEKSIRNVYRFRLEVSLLELAYQSPLQDIRSRPGASSQTEFDLADHYSRTVGGLLGPKYAKIVRKCLEWCDFGRDTNLSCEEQRVEVHKSVIIEVRGSRPGTLKRK